MLFWPCPWLSRALRAGVGLPLYRYFAAIAGSLARYLPRLTINLFSGGKHAGRQVAIQDVLMVPARPTTIDESLAMALRRSISPPAARS